MNVRRTLRHYLGPMWWGDWIIKPESPEDIKYYQDRHLILKDDDALKLAAATLKRIQYLNDVSVEETPQSLAVFLQVGVQHPDWIDS